MEKTLGKLIGSYMTENIPLMTKIAIRLGLAQHRLARYYVQELRVHEGGIYLLSRHGEKKNKMYRWKDIRRVWFERFETAKDNKGEFSFRIDIIAPNLDVIFSMTQNGCTPESQDYQLMSKIYELWHKETWRHYHVVAAIIHVVKPGEPNILSKNTRFLCTQKDQTRHHYTSFHWEFPGGKVEKGENEQEALARELKEELDYEATIDRHFITVNHDYPDFSLTLSCYLCSGKSEKFTRREHRDHRWLTPEEMKGLEWCDADADVIEKLNQL